MVSEGDEDVKYLGGLELPGQGPDTGLPGAQGRAARFPHKLWLAAGDGNLIMWSSDGGSLSVDEDRFEKYVMKDYPGLVQTPSFSNFRRQLREYGFESWVNPKTQQMHFEHPCFKRDHKDLLPGVLTRRKSSQIESPEAKTPVPKGSSIVRKSTEAEIDPPQDKDWRKRKPHTVIDGNHNVLQSTCKKVSRESVPRKAINVDALTHNSLLLKTKPSSTYLTGHKVHYHGRNDDIPFSSCNIMHMAWPGLGAVRPKIPQGAPQDNAGGPDIAGGYLQDCPSLASQDWYKHCLPWMPRPAPSTPIKAVKEDTATIHKPGQRFAVPDSVAQPVFPLCAFVGVWEWGLMGWPTLQYSPATRDTWRPGEKRSYFSL